MARNNSNKERPNRRASDRPFSHKLAMALGLMSIVTLSILSYLNKYYLKQQDDTARREADGLYNNLEHSMRPFSGDTEFSIDQIFGDSPIWGTLNSGHYFGLKLSSPNSLETSLIWFENKINQNGMIDVRHLCDQNDGMKYYSWTRHDFHSFGEQLIQDRGFGIVTNYVINPKNKLEWKAQVDIIPNQDTPTKPISVIQYVTLNRENDHIEIKSSPQSYDGKPFSVNGYSTDIGGFEMNIYCDNSEQRKNIILTEYLSARMDKENFPISLFIQSQLMPYILNGTTRLYKLPGDKISKHLRQYHDSRDNKTNLIAYQLVLKGPASITIEFKLTNSNTFEKFSNNFRAILDNKYATFERDFSRKFRLDGIRDDNVDFPANQLARVSLSNMLGSIGYFYGNSFISSDHNPNKIAPYGPIQLLSGVPSRSFFPRGFLWDEAFHNLLISRWDADLSNKIIKSWFDIMNVNGWIPREVILGTEAMRRVPQEFIVQGITNANPPAMFIVIERLVDSGRLQDTTLSSIYPKLKKWYTWFNNTQSGPKPGTFRWRGRDEFSINMLNPKTLTSGLDDYPRPSHPSSVEYHIDLRCWMALAARTLAKLSNRVGDHDYHVKISLEANLLSDNKLLEELHWSEGDQMFCDYGYNSEKSELKLVTKVRRVQGTNKEEKYQVLERHSEGRLNFECVREFGYVSMFPLLLNILEPSNEKLGIILDRIRRESEVWSPYGIRSLSKASRYYNKYNTEHDKPYWRGAIWLNINYLLLSSLESYSQLDGPYREKCAELFTELKENLINNVVDQFSRTNYTWENYDDQTGQGKGSHPFTGWTSLILLIMSSNINS